ncbi:MAG: hypothetical protein LBF15_06880 [Candidatus Peribacteria bacterium]|jgi:hypothetical protein|nr:hypothetical protein [Candidatus Peribacteria bacterium]
MKKLSLDDLKNGKLSKSVVKDLEFLKGGAAPEQFCHPVLGFQGKFWGKPDEKLA